MKQIVTVLCLAVLTSSVGVVRADDSASPKADTHNLKLDTVYDDRTDLGSYRHNSKLRRRVGIGLVAGSALFLTLGLAFVGAQKSANDGILADMTYHPREEDRRLSFQIADVSFLTLSVLAFAPGMLLIFDR